MKRGQSTSFEDKCNYLNKLKIGLGKSLNEVEDSLELEKKQKGDLEKLKRQVEVDLKLNQRTIINLERNKIEMGQVSCSARRRRMALSTAKWRTSRP